MRYLLDTNIVSDLVRRPQGRIAQRMHQVGEAAVCTSIVVAAELRFGAAKKASARLTAQLDAVLGAIEILPWTRLRTPSTERCALASSGRGNRSAATTC